MGEVMEDSASIKAKRRAEIAAWKAILAEHQKPSFWRASWQIVNTIGSYAVLWYLMYLTMSIAPLHQGPPAECDAKSGQQAGISGLIVIRRGGPGSALFPPGGWAPSPVGTAST